jgi:hypothetical protein
MAKSVKSTTAPRKPSEINNTFHFGVTNTNFINVFAVDFPEYTATDSSLSKKFNI